jgi:hypothetical protein
MPFNLPPLKKTTNNPAKIAVSNNSINQINDRQNWPARQLQLQTK